MNIRTLKDAVKCILCAIPLVCHSQKMSQYESLSSACPKLSHSGWLQRATGIQCLKGGLSGDKIFKISHVDQNYILRIFDKNQRQKRLVNEIINTHIASKQPFSPNVHSFDIQSGYILLEYLEQENFDVHNITDKQLENIAKRLHELHNGKPFPKKLSIEERNQHLYKKLVSYRQFLPIHLSTYHLGQAYLQDLKPSQSLKPSHNDLNPFNIIFRDHNFWFIDWETASMSDPLFDVATIANFLLLEQKNAYDFLAHYLNTVPSASLWIKFNKMRQVSYSHFSMKYLWYAHQMKKHHKGMSHTVLNLLYPKLQHENFQAMLNAIYQGSMTLDTVEKLQYFSLLLLREFWKQQHYVNLLSSYPV